MESAYPDRTMAVSTVIVNLVRWLVILAMPLFLLLTTARLFVADWYPRFEYAKPDFPRDRYGMDQQERLALVTVAIHYLNSPLPPEQAIEMLKVQRLPGSQSALYTRNEIGHMLDVKRVMDALWRVQVIAAILVAGGLIALLARPATRVIGLNALFGGGLLTVVLLVVLGMFVVLSFDSFFIQFHELLFPQGNWTFDYSDTLIRLLPEKLWYDAGTMIVGGTLLEGILIGVVGFVLGRRMA